MTFYAQALSGQLTLTPVGEATHTPDAPNAHLIMHAKLTFPAGTLMASDKIQPGPFTPGNNFNLSIDCEFLDQIETLFTTFATNGQVTMPLQDTFWGARFGMLEDQFGIAWMFNYDKPKP